MLVFYELEELRQDSFTTLVPVVGCQQQVMISMTRLGPKALCTYFRAKVAQI